MPAGKRSVIFWGLLLPLFAWAADPTPPNFRLGENVRPTHYAVSLKLVPSLDEFSGVMDIDLTIKEATQVIWLNGVNLTVQEAVLDAGGRKQNARVITSAKSFLGFAFDSPAEQGIGQLHIVYTGQLNTKASHGLFKNTQGGRSYIYTQFEPIDARRAFPCFDEPAFKVPWQVSVKINRDDRAFSNTLAQSESVGADGMRTLKFKETKPLPSYLIAIAVGPFDVVDAGTAGANKIPVRIITPKGRAEEAQYAAKVTPQVINELEKYFGIPYPYEKADALAVPLLGGAMENPGLVTYDQNSILIKPSDLTPARERGYASVCAHELGHHWFGDLVTMAWWNDTWLNEGFATWTSAKILERWKPEWRQPVSNVSARITVEQQDRLVSARKVRQPVESENDIANAFDGITYQKGAAVIRMFEYWMGPDKFREGVQNYLREHSYGNARAEDFFAALAAVGGPSIPPAFNSFIDQPGVPELKVALRCDAGEAPRVTMEQKRALPLGSPGSAPETWQAPVCIEYGTGDQRRQQCQLMTTAKTEMKLEGACPAWVLPNARETGYYQVNFQGDLLSRLFADGGPKLNAAERLGVLGDVTLLMNGGELLVTDFLKLVPKLANDPDRQVAARLIEGVRGLRDYTPESERANYARFVEKTFGARARQLGWTPKEGEDDETRLLRPVLVSFVADYGEDQELIAQAGTLAMQYLKDRSVSPDIGAAVLTTAAAHGDRALFDRILKEAKSAKNYREQGTLLRALGSFHDPQLAQAALQLLLTDQFDPRNALRALLFTPTEYPATRDLPYSFVKANYTALAERLSSGLTVDQGAMLPAVAAPACSENARADVQAFFGDRINRFRGGPRSLAQTLERMQICSAVRAYQEPGVAEFLKQY